MTARLTAPEAGYTRMPRRRRCSCSTARTAGSGSASPMAAKTRLQRRIANGVCPCCQRSFTDLRRHMAGQHPDYAYGTADHEVTE